MIQLGKLALITSERNAYFMEKLKNLPYLYSSKGC